MKAMCTVKKKKFFFPGVFCTSLITETYKFLKLELQMLSEKNQRAERNDSEKCV